jgi:urease accessory protein
MRSLSYLLQLSTPALPVGAYSYSEGLETLVQAQHITVLEDLQDWLQQELTCGMIRLEAIALLRVWQAVQKQESAAIAPWNQWLSALRETEEMRLQSWQMGRSLQRLLGELDSSMALHLQAAGEPCNFAIAFGIAAAHWQIQAPDALLGYLHSWVSNLINAGVKLVPLGQTQGQVLLTVLYPTLDAAVDQVLTLADDDLAGCGWGVAIASMQHETLYSRLFRS